MESSNTTSYAYNKIEKLIRFRIRFNDKLSSLYPDYFSNHIFWEYRTRNEPEWIKGMPISPDWFNDDYYTENTYILENCYVFKRAIDLHKCLKSSTNILKGIRRVK